MADDAQSATSTGAINQDHELPNPFACLAGCVVELDLWPTIHAIPQLSKSASAVLSTCSISNCLPIEQRFATQIHLVPQQNNVSRQTSSFARKELIREYRKRLESIVEGDKIRVCSVVSSIALLRARARAQHLTNDTNTALPRPYLRPGRLFTRGAAGKKMARSWA